ncbi:MAG TPA: hypothetical protein VIU93_14690 [Gallionellaceae bacterium]
MAGTIDKLVLEPTNSRAHSTFHYEYNGITHQGVAPGVTGYLEGRPITITVRRDAPEIYWVGNAAAELWSQVAWSAIGALWLSIGAAFFVRLPWSDE